MKIVSLILASFLLASCSFNPTKITIRPDGTREIVTLGGSVFTKSKTEEAVAYNPNGSKLLEMKRTGKNETGGVTSSVATYVAGNVSEAYVNARAATDNAKTAAEVAKAKDASAAAVEQAKIAAEVEKLKIVTPPAP